MDQTVIATARTKARIFHAHALRIPHRESAGITAPAKALKLVEVPVFNRCPKTTAIAAEVGVGDVAK